MKPRLLDLFCGGGGAAMGYHRAGFDVTGVDNRPQPRYPFTFIQDDALEYLEAHSHEYDAIHASPPCRDHTTLTSVAGTDGTGWILETTRRLLQSTGRPWVIENVPGAPMRADILLCGAMFALRTYRHRLFELGGWFTLQPEHRPHTVKTATRARRQAWAEGLNISVTGDVGTYLGPAAMGIDWMTGNELSQAIPPAYCEFIGERLMSQLAETLCAAKKET